MNDTEETIKLSANPVMVRRMTNYLIVAFEEFIDQEIAASRSVGYLDSFMAAHNFHCTIVFHLEREAEFTPSGVQEFRRMATDTFNRRMREEPLP